MRARSVITGTHVLLSVLVLLVTVAYAETISHNIGGKTTYFRSWDERDHLYGDEVYGRDYVSIWHGNQKRMEVETRGFNDDPNNSSGGWEMKGRSSDWCEDCDIVTVSTYMGGAWGGNTYQCDLFDCYGTTWHKVEAADDDSKEGYTSNDGEHSTSTCYTVAGC